MRLRPCGCPELLRQLPRVFAGGSLGPNLCPAGRSAPRIRRGYVPLTCGQRNGGIWVRSGAGGVDGGQVSPKESFGGQIPSLRLPSHQEDSWWRTWVDYLQDPTPQGYMILSILIGLLTGVMAFVYKQTLFAALAVVWEWVPANIVSPALAKLSGSLHWFPAADRVAWLYIVVVATMLAALNGVMLRVLGAPGDLPATVDAIHSTGMVPVAQVPAIFLCSTLSIVSGSSLGPEAAILALCAASVGWLSKNVLGHGGRALRACTLMGAASGISALFGVGLAGTMFAFEVLHRNGPQFFEPLPYALASSMVCLAAMRALSGLDPMGPVWAFRDPLLFVDSRHLAIGAILGVVSAAMALAFIKISATMRAGFRAVSLDPMRRPIVASAAGGAILGLIGAALPQTMFWSEGAIGVIANPQSPIPHVWPQGGIWAPVPNPPSPGVWAVIAVTKLLTIGISAAAGLRGGFIFPLIFAGGAMGAALAALPGVPFFSDLPIVMSVMCVGGGLNAAITRTPIASAVVLTALSGQPGVGAPCLCACLAAFFLTLGAPFVGTQRDREDICYKEDVGR